VLRACDGLRANMLAVQSKSSESKNWRPGSRWRPRLPKTPGQGLLGSWHAKLLRIDRMQCVLFCHHPTRFPLFRAGLKAAQFAQLGRWHRELLLAMLASQGVAGPTGLDAAPRSRCQMPQTDGQQRGFGFSQHPEDGKAASSRNEFGSATVHRRLYTDQSHDHASRAGRCGPLEH
jgi:hypothetical protein